MITGVIRDSYTEAIELMLIIGFIPHNFSCLGEQRVSKEGFVEWMLGILAFAVFWGQNEFSSIKYRQKIIERKIELLLEQSGLEVDQRFGVSIEVCDVVKSGAKLKAIRLYRKEMGASLRDAKRVIETLEKEIA
ncbi:hypothetical protein KUV99_12775 [Vibrio harveyi]|uniref:hypothetical protein n=1 Tax=Vibrio harveyi TaxID=669 RepID=UPI001C950864|nr:hypothetical protein [Vibrio harveyi]MBY6237035.1 hypothetical protein [Vibrio harveyi]